MIVTPMQRLLSARHWSEGFSCMLAYSVPVTTEPGRYNYCPGLEFPEAAPRQGFLCKWYLGSNPEKT